MSDTSYFQRPVNICSEISVGMYYCDKRVNCFRNEIFTQKIYSEKKNGICKRTSEKYRCFCF